MERDAAIALELGIIDGNPFVLLPSAVLDRLFDEAGRSKGPIPIRGTINGKPYQQTLVKFSGAWRLYVNLQMLDDSPRRIGETIEVTVGFDPSDREIEPHPKLLAMLAANPVAADVFDGLSPSRRKEIVRYIDALKTEESVDRNVGRARDFLLGNGRFVGRDRP
ncbi:MAG: YdeI/OmpD-associated family protein [Actinomycetota bacterium]